MSLFTIKFLATCQTKFGQVVYISGNTPELGNWNPDNAMRLYTDATLYPKWNPYKTIAVREGNKLLFKLCIVDQDKNLRWESIIGNREIHATENLLVEFTAHFEEISLTPITEEVPKPPRKKTCDILNQLQSDGSSSKEYWKQFMQEQQQSVLYITLTTQMRRTIQSQTQPLSPPHPSSRLLHNQHSDPNLTQKAERTRQVLLQTGNFYCILENAQNDQLISVLGQDSYLVKLSEFHAYSIHNNAVPVFFHVEALKQHAENESCMEVFENVARIVHAENILLGEKQKKIEYYLSVRLTWPPSLQLVSQLVKRKVALVLVQSPAILQSLLQTLLSLHLPYLAQDSTQLTILLNHASTMTVKLALETDPKLKSPSALSKKQRLHHQSKYFDSVKKLVLEHNTKCFVGWNKLAFVESVKEDDTFAGLAHHRKNVMILNAQKIQDFTSKLLTQVIALSSKPNFEVYLILDRISLDIKAKFPASKNNKIVVLSKSGSLYANQQTFVDLFQNLNLQKSKFAQAMGKIQNSITLGLESKLSPSVNETIFTFKPSPVGTLGADILKSKLHSHNQTSLHKLALEQKQPHKLCVKPFCLTEEFFLKAILDNLSKYAHEDRSLVLVVNAKNDNAFLHKANALFHKIFLTKNSVKLRTIQTLPPTEPQYPGVVRQQTVPMSYLQAELQFMCEHFLAGSHIKSYNLNILSPQRGRRSFANKLKPNDFSYENF